MSDSTTCGRGLLAADDWMAPVAPYCPTCGATNDEPCPLDDLTPGLLSTPAIGAVRGGDCSGDDGVCEACQ